MLDYQWGNLSPAMLSGDQAPEPNRPVFQPHAAQSFYETASFNPEGHFTVAAVAATPHDHQNHLMHTSTNTHFAAFDDSSAYTSSTSSYPHHRGLALEPVCETGFVVEPKTEQMVGGCEFKPESRSRIGLNLGGRTYFASREGDFVHGFYFRPRALEPGPVNSPRCQVEGCGADLTHAKHYHRRHKVCEFHSKAATVVAAGLTQRFCQQCSRFHLLSEFDNGKRSCRRRLADHNRRRRKSHQSNQETIKSQLADNNAPNPSSSSLPRTPPPPPDGGAHSSSATFSISPPGISLDCPYNTGGATSSSTSTSSFFY